MATGAAAAAARHRFHFMVRSYKMHYPNAIIMNVTELSFPKTTRRLRKPLELIISLGEGLGVESSRHLCMDSQT